MVTKSKIFYYFYIFFILKSISCYLVFPFKTISENLFPNINTNSKEYNSTHFLKENFQKLIYTTIKVGNPAQEIKSIITYNDCNFKIGKAKKCVNSSDYLSHFNRNLSDSFSFTDFYAFPLSEFDYKGHSAEDIIYAYTDLKLETLKKYENIGFYLGSDTTDSLCGIIGFRMRDYAEFCRECNNILKSFKSKDIINNYQWMLSYTSINEGYLIIGGDLSELIPNYNMDKLYSTYSIFGGSYYPWMIAISKIEGENNYNINDEEVKAEINNDYSVIVGGYNYMNYIDDYYFYAYQKKNICSTYVINYVDNYKYHVYECDKEYFGEDDIDKFPKLIFTFRNSAQQFIFEGKDLFIETKYKFFFNIVFPSSWSQSWILGKTFIKKYPTMIDFDSKMINIYNEGMNNNNDKSEEDESDGDHKSEEDENNNNSDKNEENKKNNNKLSTKYIILIIFLIIVLISIFSILFYYIGKNLNKIRKKKANELNDGYDYTIAEENNIINEE